MKNFTVLLITFYLSLVTAYCQEFSYPLYFIDSQGNKDTLLIGYDVGATDSIDIEFDELDISNEPWKDTFETRIGDVKFSGEWDHESPSYQSKKQIISKFCHHEHKVCLNIYCQYFPLTIKWDTNYFTGDQCNLGSLINSCDFFEWDVLCGNNAFLNQNFFPFTNDSIVLDSVGQNGQDIMHYYHEGNKIISMIWFSFANPSTLPPVGILDNQAIELMKLYPNPSHNTLKIKISDIFSTSSKIRIYDMVGILVSEYEIRRNEPEAIIAISNIPAGMYNVVYCSDNINITKRWLKIEP